MTKQITKIDITELLEEYGEDKTIWNEEEEIVRKAKYIVYNCLNETERRIILLYADLGSQREVAKALNVSASTINIIVNKIRKKINDILNNNSDNTDNCTVD